MKEIQVFHFGEQMFKCPEGGGWRQKMRCEKICESGVKHVFPRGGEGPSLSAPSPTNSKHNASLHGQRAASGLGTVGGAAFAKQHLGLVPLSCPPTPVPSPPPPPHQSHSSRQLCPGHHGHSAFHTKNEPLSWRTITVPQGLSEGFKNCD